MSRPRCASEGASIATRTGISWDNAQCFEAGDALNPAQRTHPAAELQNKIRSGRFFRELGILTGRRSGDFISLLAGPKFLAITTRKPTRAALCASPRMMNRRAVTACGAGFLRGWHGSWALRHSLVTLHVTGGSPVGIEEPPVAQQTVTAPPRYFAVRSELLHFLEAPSLLSDNDRISTLDHACRNER